MKALNKLGTAALLWAVAVSAQGMTYQVTRLDTTNLSSSAFGINNRGEVAGRVWNGSNDIATIWSNGGARYLTATGFESTSAHAINDNGQAIGSGGGFDAAGNYQSRAITWLSDGSARILAQHGNNLDHVSAINNAGVIVGQSYSDSYSRLEAVIWNGDEVVQLAGLASGNAGARDINDKGQIVGFSTGADGTSVATLWENGVARELSGVSGKGAIALALNDSGAAVGVSDLDDSIAYAGALWSKGSVQALHGVDDLSSASAINNWNQVVGTGTAGNWGNWVALLWDKGQVYDLNTLLVGDKYGFTQLTDGYGINDAGQIVGIGRVAEGGIQAFLLTPVPEPHHWAMLLTGLALVTWSARRGK